LSIVLISVTSYLVVKKLRNRERIEPEDSDRSSEIDVEVHKEKQNLRATDMDLQENKSNVPLE
jgi:hypothetical protein